MALYKNSVDFLPQLSKEEIEEEYKVSRAAVYAAVLPLLASFIWVISALINATYKNDLKEVEGKILGAEQEIETYQDVRELQTELVLKIDLLTDTVNKDFHPQIFFDNVDSTIKSTGDAEARVYAYKRRKEGNFIVSGKADSYLDLAKIMVAFNKKDSFTSVDIQSISYDKEKDDVNFEIDFSYFNEEEV